LGSRESERERLEAEVGVRRGGIELERELKRELKRELERERERDRVRGEVGRERWDVGFG